MKKELKKLKIIISIIALILFIGCTNPNDTTETKIKFCNSLGYEYYYEDLQFMSPTRYVCYNSSIIKKEWIGSGYFEGDYKLYLNKESIE